MSTHEPKNYHCPICSLIKGEESEHNRLSDIVYEDHQTLAFISPKWWPNNPGHVMVVTKEHYENLYLLSHTTVQRIALTVQRLALAIKEVYQCDGISTRQHNEPAGNQDLWHFHTHIFPRYHDDRLYVLHEQARYVAAEDREPYAQKLRAYFASHTS